MYNHAIHRTQEKTKSNSSQLPCLVLICRGLIGPDSPGRSQTRNWFFPRTDEKIVQIGSYLWLLCTITSMSEPIALSAVYLRAELRPLFTFTMGCWFTRLDKRLEKLATIDSTERYTENATLYIFLFPISVLSLFPIPYFLSTYFHYLSFSFRYIPFLPLWFSRICPFHPLSLSVTQCR